VILSMYGGGFATVPAYLADIFGTRFVGAIHGRLLTAWSTAGVVGPLIIGYIRDAQIAAGVERSQVYDRTLYILAGFLVVGLICNALVGPVDSKWLMKDDAAPRAAGRLVEGHSYGIGLSGKFGLGSALAWLAVGLPIAWGAWQTLQSAVRIFE
jgi:MFS family permease